MKSITSSSGHGTNSALENQHRRDSFGNTENTPLKSAFSLLHLNIDLDRIQKTRDIEISEDDDFLTIKANYDRQAYAHHMVTGYNAPQNSVPEFLKGGGLT